ncbi:hypothetical protein BH11GEM1_BH11GEM1_11720 [soil metagenome]
MYTARIEAAEEGGFNAFIPALGCATWGRTEDEAATAAREAAEAFVESLQLDHQPIPVETAPVSVIQFGIKVHVAA